MLETHNKLTIREFVRNVWTDCADGMTGRFSAPFVLVFGLAATWLSIKYDFFGLLLSCVVIYSSYKQVERERNKLIALEEKIDNREIRQKAIDELWELRSFGIHHRNEDIPPIAENAKRYKKWHDEYWKWWRTDVLNESKKISVNLEKWLNRLGTLNSLPLLSAPFNNSHQKDREIMSEVLARLEEYLKGEIYNIPRIIPKLERTDN